MPSVEGIIMQGDFTAAFLSPPSTSLDLFYLVLIFLLLIMHFRKHCLQCLITVDIKTVPVYVHVYSMGSLYGIASNAAVVLNTYIFNKQID